MKKRHISAIILLTLLTFPLMVSCAQSGGELIYGYTSTVVIKYVGNNETILDEDYSIFNFPMNTSWQTIYLNGSSSTYKIVNDSDGNLNIVLDTPPLSNGESATLSTSLRIITRQRKPPNLNVSASGSLSDIPLELQKYTIGSRLWLIDNMTLRDKAYTIKGDKDKVLDVVISLANWIGNNIKPYSSDVPLYPTETYDSQKGDCDDQANLLITFCRILGIPAYLQIGMLESSSQAKESYWNDHLTYSTKYVSYHAWAVIYVPPWGWLPFDMTLSWSPSDGLSVVKEATAWSSRTIQIMNITVSDWAGEGKKQRDEILNSQLYLQYEDALIEEAQKPVYNIFLQNWQAITVATLTIIVLGLVIRSHKKRM